MHVNGISNAIYLSLMKNTSSDFAWICLSGKKFANVLLISVIALFGQNSFAGGNSHEIEAKIYAEERINLETANNFYDQFRAEMILTKEKKLRISYSSYMVMTIDRELASEQKYNIPADELTRRMRQVRAELQLGLDTPCEKVAQTATAENKDFYLAICKSNDNSSDK